MAGARGAWRCATGTGVANAQSEGVLLLCLVAVCLHIVDGSGVAVAVIECYLQYHPPSLHHHHPLHRFIADTLPKRLGELLKQANPF
jgi:hypothetical protein